MDRTSKKVTIKQYLISFLVITVIAFIASFVMHGIPLMGLPDAGDIVRVEIRDARFGEEPRILTDTEEIELARNAANFLKYKPGTLTEAKEKGIITIRYQKENGEEISLSANETTVWWKGKGYRIKEEGTFVKVIEGIFFFEKAAKQ